jgi:hypothetical protein
VDWKPEIVKGVLDHQRLREPDKSGLWTYHLPQIAASEDEIAATESQIGFRLDQQVRSFLRYANGWCSFYQDVDILGTPALLGAEPMQCARLQPRATEPELFRGDVGENLDDVLPIAASRTQPDMWHFGFERGQQCP